MKKLGIFLFALIVSSVCFIAFTGIKLGGITGRVNPANAVISVSLAAAGADTLKAQVNDGAFTFTNLKQGVYTVWIKANAPYKDTVIDNIAVKDSATTDLGEIKLQQ
ncbi:carboxypeptidase regulatory-like domain-containing protein [Pedobacter nototheniae]|uniref:carboxypeptidase-like regulatory domain-containing protein n=1 Tax=Pedobacter nototheniae TaxID=2488994 RepID=UPI002931235B|nr:carboxypeptidase regulatory-like domain-containing protein [Pedobacter nototheniae]